MKGLDAADIAVLSAISDPSLLAELFETAKTVKTNIYGRRLVLLPRAVVTSALLRPRGFVPIAEGCAGSWFVKAFPS